MKLNHALLCSLVSLLSLGVSAKESLRVYAASSMTNVVTEIAQQFERQHNIEVITVFAGSSSLARQLVNGAPADVFISANRKWMDYLIDSDIVTSDAVKNLVENKLVLVAPKGIAQPFDLSNLSKWEDALVGGRLAIGMPNAVPAGIYAKQSLKSLGIWNWIEKSLAPSNNVRVVLALVERQEVPLGIVYQTDARLSKKVDTLAVLPEQSHQPIVYPMASLNDKSYTREFIGYLQSEQSQALFSKYGFEPGSERVD